MGGKETFTAILALLSVSIQKWTN